MRVLLLDLDDTLIKCCSRSERQVDNCESVRIDYVIDGYINENVNYMRDDLRQFIAIARTYFDRIYILSAGRDYYVLAQVRFMFAHLVDGIYADSHTVSISNVTGTAVGGCYNERCKTVMSLQTHCGVPLVSCDYFYIDDREDVMLSSERDRHFFKILPVGESNFDDAINAMIKYVENL